MTDPTDTIRSTRRESIWREGDRIVSHFHGGFSDTVPDAKLERYSKSGSLRAEDRAFAAAALAFRRFERVGAGER